MARRFQYKSLTFVPLVESQTVNIPVFSQGGVNIVVPVRFQYQSRFEVPTVQQAGETITLDKWFARSEIPNRAKRNQHLYSSVFMDVLPPTPPRVDSWFQQTQTPTRKQKPVTGGGFFFVRVEVSSVTNIPVFSQGTVNIVVPVRFQYQSMFRDLTVPAVGEVVTIDKWFQPIQLPPKKAKRGIIGVPAVTAPVHIVAPQIYFEISQPRGRKTPNYLHTPVTVPVRFQVPEVLFTLSQPTLRHKQLQYLYRFYFADERSFEIATLDKWFSSNNQPYFTRPHYGYLYPTWNADKYTVLAYNGILLGYDNDTNTIVGRRILGNIGKDSDSGIGIGQRGAINIGWDRDTNTGIGKKLP